MGFRVEITCSPVPDAKERLKRAFSLVLRAYKQSSDSGPLNPAETQEIAAVYLSNWTDKQE